MICGLRLGEVELAPATLPVLLVMVTVNVRLSAASASNPSSGIWSGAPARRVTLGRAASVGEAKRSRDSSSCRKLTDAARRPSRRRAAGARSDLLGREWLMRIFFRFFGLLGLAGISKTSNRPPPGRASSQEH